MKIVYQVLIKRVAEIAYGATLGQLQNKLLSSPEKFLNQNDDDSCWIDNDDFDVESEQYTGQYEIEDDNGEVLFGIKKGKFLTEEQWNAVKSALRSMACDAEMALCGDWDRGDDGFECSRDLAVKTLAMLGEEYEPYESDEEE